ncbi:ABC transporter permease [Leucobacter sp. wl10]|uniref:ABC transporter permease n=1 Tax=Leucobacter sp. wl10 TaxID=2304677 RepID=UPI000E5A3770|nr:ABC transporter permease [Leucobacter sp. wl10]RGE21921.1 ABC transporter permease [Leucobacter sp. wl10]
MNAMTGAVPGASSGTRSVPGVLRTGLSRVGFEVRGYFRAADGVFFGFLFPVVLLGIFGAAFASLGEVGAKPDGSGGISMAAYYLPGMAAAGVLLTGVQNLAMDIAHEKGAGWLRRLGGTPLSPVSYFIGKAGMVLISGLLQMALLLLFAALVFRIQLPTDPELWLRFAWIFGLGIATMSLLGVALSALPRSAKSATAVILPILLVLQFISGVYLDFSMLPAWLQNIASFFPLKWVAQGMRSVFLPEHFAASEPSGGWDLGLMALNLGIWLVAGLVLSVLSFRWVKRS